MEKEEIKKRIENIYKGIKGFEKDLENIRKNVCKHEETEEGLYEWGGPGHIIKAEICSICGEFIKNLEPEIDFYYVTNSEK